MKLIESKAEYIPQESGLEGIYKQIELAGRTAYKSEDKITTDSAKGFVDRMIKSNHGACLEHGTVYLKMPVLEKTSYRIYSYSENPYSKTKIGHMEGNPFYCYIISNFRVLQENSWLDDLKYLCEPTEYHEERYTMKFTCDRGISHELVRHRVFSFLQESTRYCNYSKDKFENTITFIRPSWINDTREFKNSEAYSNAYERFVSACEEAEGAYFDLIEEGFTPQQARQVLPNALKTEIIMTGFASDWKNFFDLRLYGKTGAPHPDMKELATKAMIAMQDAGIWMDIESKESKFK